ncbi:MAG: hypothetical protein WCA21_17100 [Terracidiphilus sp.]
METVAPIRRAKPSEEGYMLVAVIFLVALLTISLAIALPRMSKAIQRDRELETMQRGKQYIRAIKMYYKKFGAYPPNVDALVKGTNNIRFLRKKYADPTTGKEDWKPVLLGQNKAPTAMGFFGQPLMGSTMAGVGPGGANTPSGPGGLSSQSQSTNFGTQSTNIPGSANGGFGGNGGPGANSGPGGNSGDNSSSPNGGATSGGTDSGSGGSGSSSNGSGSTDSLTGQTFGGLGIIGFSPNSPKKSIMIYKTKDHYNEWEFVFDPRAEQLMMMGGTTGLSSQQNSQQNPAQNSTPGSNSTPSFNPSPPPNTPPNSPFSQ